MTAPYTLHPPPPRQQRLERAEPLHRLGGCAPHRAGRRGGRRAGELLAEAGLHPRHRCTRRCSPARSRPRTWRWKPPTACGSPSSARWRLNERHYGALQGKDKAQTLEEFGAGAVHAVAPLVRRAAAAARRRRASSARSATRATPASAASVPRTECLKDVIDRMLPYWERDIVRRPARRQDRAGHGARQLAARARQAPRRHLATRTSPS